MVTILETIELGKVGCTCTCGFCKKLGALVGGQNDCNGRFEKFLKIRWQMYACPGFLHDGLHTDCLLVEIASSEIVSLWSFFAAQSLRVALITVDRSSF